MDAIYRKDLYYINRWEGHGVRSQQTVPAWKWWLYRIFFGWRPRSDKNRHVLYDTRGN
jgi:hypothetical protein